MSLYINAFYSSRWRYSKTLQNPTVGRGRIFHCPTNNIQVILNSCVRNILTLILSFFSRTLQELVEHYSKDSDGLCVNLCKPCVQVSIQKIFKELSKIHSPNHIHLIISIMRNAFKLFIKLLFGLRFFFMNYSLIYSESNLFLFCKIYIFKYNFFETFFAH